MSAAHTGAYATVGQIWAGVTRPPLTMAEALRAARRLTRHFGAIAHGAPHQLVPARLPTRARRCWATSRTNVTLDKGWERLVHDVAHTVFRHRHPKLPPHHPSHARLEREMAAYVVARGWLDGKLAPAAKVAPSLDERRAAKRASVEARLARWQTRAKRAATAIRKLRATLKRIERAAANPRPKPAPVAKPAQTAPAAPASPFPLVILIAHERLADFAGSEEGAHEDGEQEATWGASAYSILTRHRARIEVRTEAECNVVYYACASGTFSEHHPSTAERIAQRLRPHCSPELQGKYSMGAL